MSKTSPASDHSAEALSHQTNSSGSTISENTAVDMTRYCIYSLLGHFYKDVPDDETLQIPKQLLLSETFTKACDTKILGMIEKLQQSVEHTPTKKIRSDFHKLFIGVTEGLVNPYASWYLTGAMMGNPLIKVRRDLQNLGFERNDNNCQPEDYLGNLLEVMALLTDDETYDVQAVFFYSHINSWIEKLLDDIDNNISDSVYKVLSALTREFIKKESAFFSRLKIK